MIRSKTTEKAIRILRVNDVLKRTGLPKSSLYEKVKYQLMTPPINLGARAVGWPDFEIDKINRALIAGCDADEIKVLVNELISNRGNIRFGGSYE